MEEQAQESRSNQRRFRIQVVGRLDQRFVDGLDEIELEHSAGGSKLEGLLVDQSQLRGILDRLWQLGIEVMSFETYAAGAADGGTTEHTNPSP